MLPSRQLWRYQYIHLATGLDQNIKLEVQNLHCVFVGYSGFSVMRVDGRGYFPLPPPCFFRSRTAIPWTTYATYSTTRRPQNPPSITSCGEKKKLKNIPHPFPPPMSSLNAGQGLRPYYPRLWGRGWGIAAHIMGRVSMMKYLYLST